MWQNLIRTIAVTEEKFLLQGGVSTMNNDSTHAKRSRQKSRKQKGGFRFFARAAARWTRRPTTFAIAALVVIVWAATGPLFHFSDTWQLVINTGTTIVTFLMVFLIQNTQNRDATAMHLKIDELITAVKTAHNEMIDIEELDEKELDALREDYERL